jgi:hypothetical protein
MPVDAIELDFGPTISALEGCELGLAANEVVNVAAEFVSYRGTVNGNRDFACG